MNTEGGIFTTIHSEIFQGLPQEALFHYTSYDGLHGIIGTTKLWLTDYKHLNDNQELKDFKLWLNYEIIERHGKYVDKFRSSHKLEGTMGNGADMQVHKDFTNMLAFQSWINLRFGHESYSTFIGSFSEKGNLLSQWRGYC